MEDDDAHHAITNHPGAVHKHRCYGERVTDAKAYCEPVCWRCQGDNDRSDRHVWCSACSREVRRINAEADARELATKMVLAGKCRPEGTESNAQAAERCFAELMRGWEERDV